MSAEQSEGYEFTSAKEAGSSKVTLHRGKERLRNGKIWRGRKSGRQDGKRSSH